MIYKYGYTGKQSLHSLNDSWQSWLNSLPFYNQVSAVGHAAMLAAIKKYMPYLVILNCLPLCFIIYSFATLLILFSSTAFRSLLRILLSGWMSWNSWRELKRWKLSQGTTLKIPPRNYDEEIISKGSIVKMLLNSRIHLSLKHYHNLVVQSVIGRIYKYTVGQNVIWSFECIIGQTYFPVLRLHANEIWGLRFRYSIVISIALGVMSMLLGSTLLPII